MISRRSFLATAAAVSALPALPAFAFSGGAKFTPADLEAAQKAGKPILVDVTAPWCPTCRAQKAVFSELEKDPRFKGFVTLQVDYDTQKKDLQQLKANRQSTLIVYKGSTEVGRVVGETRRDAIEALLLKAL